MGPASVPAHQYWAGTEAGPPGLYGELPTMVSAPERESYWRRSQARLLRREASRNYSFGSSWITMVYSPDSSPATSKSWSGRFAE